MAVVVGGFCLLTLGAAVLWLGEMTYATPTLLSAGDSSADPAGIDRRLAALGRRPPGRAARPEPLVFTEAEVAMLLERCLEDAGVPISRLQTKLRTTEITVQGRVPLGVLLEGAPITWLSSAMPRWSLEAPVWVTLAGTLTVHAAPSPRRPGHGEVTLVDGRLGRLSVPGWLLPVMAGSRGASLLHWQLPASVERLEVEDGRLTVRMR